MIIVEVYVASLDKKYDFEMDERLTVTALIEALTDSICQKEQCRLVGEEGRMTLWNKETWQMLERGETLYTSHVMSGSSLLLV